MPRRKRDGEILATGAVLDLDALQSIPADRASVERYLEETGLTAAAVLSALNLAKTPDFPHARERLTEEEIETGGRLGTELIALERWAWLAGRLKHPDAPERPEYLPEAEGVAVLAALAALPALPFGAVPVRGTLAGLAPTQRPIYRALEDARRETVETLKAHAPTYRNALAERRALDAKARLSPAELHERITAYLTRSDGTVAPSPAAWCAAHGVELAALEQALYTAHVATLQAERDRLAGELERARMLPLRIGSRAVTTHTRQPGAPWRDELKRLKASRVLSAEDFDALEKSEPVPLKGDELLVVAGLLAMARREPGFRAFGPASARMGSYTFEARFLVPKPRLEEFCRLLGYTPTKSGTVPGGDRAKVTRALETLTKTPRPIVVRRREREGQQWRETFLVARDLPIRDEGEHYALHASLFDGFFHGALIFDRVPQQWDAARAALRVRNITDAMKQGDVYFRLLALGVLTGRRREFLARRCAELEKDGLSRRAAKRKAVKEWPEHKPPTLAKKIRHETLLANLNLTEWREKQGQTKARETLETVLEFARAVEGCPLTAWEWLGTGKLPAHLELTFATPGLADDPEDDLEEQGELFAATLGPGDPVPGAEQ